METCKSFDQTLKVKEMESEDEEMGGEEVLTQPIKAVGDVEETTEGLEEIFDLALT